MPWPQAANGGGASLQLIDASQDNWPVANWEAVPPAPAQPWLLFTYTQPWRYNQTGVDPGETWHRPDYDDSSWPSGPGLLYVENADLPAPKSTPLTLGPLTYYFRTTFDHPGPVLGTRLIARVIVDDAAVVYLNGQELLRVGFSPDTVVTHGMLAERLVNDATIETFELDSSLLRRGRNVVAAQVHQVNAGSSDIVWGMQLELRPVADPTTPGRPNSVARALPEFPPLVLNEVSVLNTQGPVDNAGEREPWIELHHAAPWPLSLEGWYLTDSLTNWTRWPFPPGTVVPAYGFPVLWADGEPQESTAEVLHTSFRLSQSSVVCLVREQPGGPAVVDYVRLPMLEADRSYGSLPDGQPIHRFVLTEPSPGMPNSVFAPPALQARLAPDGATVEFAWPAVPGVRYQVEVTESLSPPRWRTVVDLVAPGELVRCVEPRSAEPRFYRLVIP
jgi:hypothetical protein